MAWTLADVVSVVGIAATLLVSVVSLGISLKALSQSRTLELAKLSSHLWEKQAQFASEFWPAIEGIAQAVGKHGYSYVQETADQVENARLILVRHAPFLTDEVYSSAERFLLETIKMMRLSNIKMPAGEARKKVLDDAMAILDEFFLKLGFTGEQRRLRDLLHTNELSAARASALGLTKSMGKGK